MPHVPLPLRFGTLDTPKAQPCMLVSLIVFASKVDGTNSFFAPRREVQTSLLYYPKTNKLVVTLLTSLNVIFPDSL